MARPKDDELAAAIGENIRKRLGTKHGSKSALAKATGVTHYTVDQLCKGERCPTLIVLIRMADYFKVSVDELLGRGKAATSINAEARGYVAGLRLAADAIADLSARLHDKADNTLPRKN